MQNPAPCASFHAEDTVRYHRSSDDGFIHFATCSFWIPELHCYFLCFSPACLSCSVLWIKVRFLLSLLELTFPSWHPHPTPNALCLSGLDGSGVIWLPLQDEEFPRDRRVCTGLSLYTVDTTTEFLTVWIARQWFLYLWYCRYRVVYDLVNGHRLLLEFFLKSGTQNASIIRENIFLKRIQRRISRCVFVSDTHSLQQDLGVPLTFFFQHIYIPKCSRMNMYYFGNGKKETRFENK